MQPQNDEGPFEWIRLGRDQLADSGEPNWAGNFVSHLMPPVFEAYAKVLHRIEVRLENIDTPLSPDVTSNLRIPASKDLRLFVESRRANSQDSRIRWRELAELLNVPFVPEIGHQWYVKNLWQWGWPRFLRGPDEGRLGLEECRQLASVLKPFTERGECFFRFSPIPLIPTNKPILFYGSLDGLEGFLEAGVYRFSPEYWWTPDRSWCVCTDYDLVFTVVGGSRRLISALLASDVLECLEVTPKTRIDWSAPMPSNQG